MGPDASSIAVLYFDDLSDDGGLGYVADGVTEGLIRQLSRVQGLDVISRNGVAPYRGTDVTPDSIGRALEVGSVIRGSVEPEGDAIRVTAQLLEGSSGARIQSASFALPATDLLAVMDSAAQSVSRILREWIGEEVRLRALQGGASTTEAWVLVQRGEKLRKDAEELVAHDAAAGALAYEQADSLLALAEAAAPEWVEPIVMRGNIAYRNSRLAHSAADRRSWVDAAVGHADRALAVMSNDAAALEVRGTARYFCWLRCEIHDADARDSVFAVAKADLESAVDEDPSLASAYSTLSHLYYQTGDVPSVVMAARSAYEADSYLRLAGDILYRLFFGHHDLEQLNLADQRCNEGSQRFPTDFRFATCQLLLMTTSEREPDVDEAWSLLQRVQPPVGDDVQGGRPFRAAGRVVERRQDNRYAVAQADILGAGGGGRQEHLRG